MKDLMRVMVLSSVFPSRARPTFGVFVRERVRHVAASCEVVVVAPVPWFPLNRWWRGHDGAGMPFREAHDELAVFRPRFLCVPGVGKSLDGVLYALSVLPFLLWLRRRFPFDLIDAHFSYPDGVAAALLGAIFRRPVIITLRGSHDRRHASYRLRRAQIRWALRRAGTVLSVSESLRQNFLPLAGANARMRVVPNGVDPQRFVPTDRGTARTELGLSQDAEILIAVGNLLEGKGHGRLIDLLPSLVRRRPKLLLLIVGPETPRDETRQILEQQILRHQLQEHVRLIPPQPHDRIPRWLAAANVFCLATRDEGWCNAVMEALACGVPVVTTRVGGNPELVRDEQDGFLVQFWDSAAFAAAIERALDTSWNRDAIATHARQNGWDRTAAAVVSEFRSVLVRGGDVLPAREVVSK